jgi:hypothetical protein
MRGQLSPCPCASQRLIELTDGRLIEKEAADALFDLIELGRYIPDDVFPSTRDGGTL